MNPKDISQAKNPDLRASLEAMRRAAALARQTAIQTGTNLVIYKDGKLLRLSAETLRKQAENGAAPT
ncbi:hypothetical protein [Bythopirellula goksoeyrii]|uniref:Uncharacterized protein n=1 Tax=Bythopirellula goksoeyrii TaxID=1400387 RepID=A0A5B9Q6J8_9BACT|nr:hypothetical protein [Bythopirellula goksoeyrii]QEG33339.1 hypothetical protein Pr1d_06000 [Bythopirellula goksoeyrii]